MSCTTPYAATCRSGIGWPAGSVKAVASHRTPGRPPSSGPRRAASRSAGRIFATTRQKAGESIWASRRPGVGREHHHPVLPRVDDERRLGRRPAARGSRPDRPPRTRPGRRRRTVPRPRRPARRWPAAPARPGAGRCGRPCHRSRRPPRPARPRAVQISTTTHCRSRRRGTPCGRHLQRSRFGDHLEAVRRAQRQRRTRRPRRRVRRQLAPHPGAEVGRAARAPARRRTSRAR